MADERITVPIDLLHTRGQVLQPTGGASFSMAMPTTTRVIWLCKSHWDALDKDERADVANYFYDLFEKKGLK
jgi:hypothetical protein